MVMEIEVRTCVDLYHNAAKIDTYVSTRQKDLLPYASKLSRSCVVDSYYKDGTERESYDHLYAEFTFILYC